MSEIGLDRMIEDKRWKTRKNRTERKFQEKRAGSKLWKCGPSADLKTLDIKLFSASIIIS